MKINDSIKQKTFNFKTEKYKNSLTKNYKFLLSHKLSIVKTLSLIKKLQLDCISNTKPCNNLIKQLLFSFKDILNSSLKEKEKIYQKIKADKEEKTKNVQNILFSVKEETITIKSNNNKIYNKELNQIKSLNFEIENKIKCIDFSIEQKNKIIKAKSLFDNEKKLINKKDKFKYYLNISNIFEYNMKNITKQLEDINKINMEKKIKLDLMSNKIFNLKNMIKDYKKIKNKNKKNENEKLNEFLKTTVTISDIKIIGNKNKDNIDKEYDKESFHSSLYTDSFSINKEEQLYLTKTNKNIGEKLNLSNDLINTDNSNNIHFSDKAIYNNEYNNTISDGNYIFSNILDNE